MKTLLICYIVSVIGTYYACRAIIKKASKIDDVPYWGWEYFFSIIIFSFTLPIANIIIVYLIFFSIKLPKFPKWL